MSILPLPKSPRQFRLCHSGPWAVFCALLLATIGVAERGVAQISVTTTQQGVTDTSNCSVQEAIYAAEFGTNKAISQIINGQDVTYQTGCRDSSGNWDTIVLQNTTYSFTQFWDGDAHNPFGPTATPIIFKTMTIQGNGATLQWTGAGNSRLFAVGFANLNNLDDGTSYSGTGNLTLQHVYIKNFHVKGGDGSGGGLGAGGAIYVGKIPGSGVPALTVEDSTFEFNGANGGNGEFTNSAGGGGLGGNGGDGPLSGGGGGGSRGDGGNGTGNDQSGGGGGGGTVFTGGNGTDQAIGGSSGFMCGGNGGDGASFSNDGHDATCAGGGGGGGGIQQSNFPHSFGNGGNGNYGGGGGGGGGANGGHGGFGGGGGGGDCLVGSCGGDAGFGGGGGASVFGNGTSSAHGGKFGGDANGEGGGGGGALGGAIFNDSGNIVIQNSTLYNNFVSHGLAGCCGADNGADAGGAIFSRSGSTTIQNVTISGNQATGSGGGVEVMNDGATTSFILDNTIIANNGALECISSGTITTNGSANNLIVNNSGCPQATVTSDPKLDFLKLNSPGDTPTMGLLTGSPAVDAGDDNTALGADQRGVTRPQGPQSDIGAYERIPSADLSISKRVASSTAKAGDTVTYTLTVTNLGTDTANSVTVSDNYPSALTFVSCTATGGGSCTAQGGTVVITYSSLAASGSQTITITGTLNSGFSRGTIITNDASVQASSPDDPDASNNSASASFAVIVPDFTLTADSPITILVAGNTNSQVTVGSIDTFSSAVSLTAAGPAGFHETFTVNPVTPPSNGSASSSMNVRLEPSVTAGTYTVDLTGTSGALTHSASVTVNVVTSLPAMMNVINTDQSLGCIDNSGIAGALNAKLTSAQNALSAGQTQTEVNTLQALLNQLYAQSGKHIKTTCMDGSGTTFNPDATLVSDVNNLLAGVGAALKNPITGNVVNGSGVGLSGITVNLLTSKNATVTTATTDAMGYYYFPATSSLTSGANYDVKVIVPRAYKNSSPSSQGFTWKSAAVSLNNFVLN